MLSLLLDLQLRSRCHDRERRKLFPDLADNRHRNVAVDHLQLSRGHVPGITPSTVLPRAIRTSTWRARDEAHVQAGSHLQRLSGIRFALYADGDIIILFVSR